MSIDVLQHRHPGRHLDIDPSHSEVGFTVRHLMSKVRGQFEKFEGQIVTGDAPSRRTATIDLNSINTRDENRDAHLRSGDFFDVEKNGPMTFASTARRGRRQGPARHRRPVPQGRHQAGRPRRRGPRHRAATRGAAPRVGFEGTTSISRKDFGVDFNIPLDGGRLMIGDKIDIIIAVEAVLEQDADPSRLISARARSMRTAPGSSRNRVAVAVAFRRGSAQPLEDHRHALAAADAHGDQAGRLVVPVCSELSIVVCEPGAGHAERVADRDRAAVDVEPVEVDAEVLVGRHDLRRERLVDLDQVDVVDASCRRAPAPAWSPRPGRGP